MNLLIPPVHAPLPMYNHPQAVQRWGGYVSVARQLGLRSRRRRRGEPAEPRLAAIELLRFMLDQLRLRGLAAAEQEGRRQEGKQQGGGAGGAQQRPAQAGRGAAAGVVSSTGTSDNSIAGAEDVAADDQSLDGQIQALRMQLAAEVQRLAHAGAGRPEQHGHEQQQGTGLESLHESAQEVQVQEVQEPPLRFPLVADLLAAGRQDLKWALQLHGRTALARM